MQKVEEIFTYNRLYKSFKECKKGTMWKGSVIDFNANYVENLWTLQEEICEGRYQPYPDNINYINERGKIRMIHSQHIRDRIVHKVINQDILIPLLHSQFIWQNTASQKDKGMDFAMQTFKCHLNRAYRKWGNDFYVLSIDMKSYFESIPHKRIEELLRKKISDPEILRLCMITADTYGGNKGIGLGSEMNQTFALLCLNEFDHIIKERFRIEEYARYMDDMYLMSNDKELLFEILLFAAEYFNKIDMTMNQKKTMIFPIKNGVTFLGFKWFVTETGHVIQTPRKQTIIRNKRKLRKFRKKIDSGEFTYNEVKNSYASMRGHLQRGNCKSVVDGMDKYYKKTIGVAYT